MTGRVRGHAEYAFEHRIPTESFRDLANHDLTLFDYS